jgi:hypothetical protein
MATRLILLLLVPVVTGCAAATSGGGATGQPASRSAAAPLGLDLSEVLHQPPGMLDYPDFPIAGPVRTPDEVKTIFSEHPDDAQQVLAHGFTGGYVRAWRSPQPAPPTDVTAVPELPETVTALGIVLQFADPAGAQALLAHFREHARADGQLFDVPAALGDAYGVLIKAGTDVATYDYAVAWTEGPRLFSLDVSYLAPHSPDQVLTFALAQHQPSR